MNLAWLNRQSLDLELWNSSIRKTYQKIGLSNVGMYRVSAFPTNAHTRLCKKIAQSISIWTRPLLKNTFCKAKKNHRIIFFPAVDWFIFYPTTNVCYFKDYGWPGSFTNIFLITFCSIIKLQMNVYFSDRHSIFRQIRRQNE